MLWLCHSDARQVSDLPAMNVSSSQGSSTRLSGHRPLDSEGSFRQVKDLPRIGVAEPLRV
jgi:hypothetical protein